MVKRPSSTRNSGKKKKRRFDNVYVDEELVQTAISKFEEEQTQKRLVKRAVRTQREIEAIGELSLCAVSLVKTSQDLLTYLKEKNAFRWNSRACELKCSEDVNEVKDYMSLKKTCATSSQTWKPEGSNGRYHSSIRINPSNFVFHLRRALILFGQKSDVEAIGELRKKDAFYKECLPAGVSSCESVNVEISRQIRWYRAGAETVEDSKKSRVFADRAQANLLLKRYDEALSDANAALSEDECNFLHRC
uniref:Uncharacterized protein n=1 Tax=Ditylenchus dipsaci TaxID=166011 RepID=A0A915DVC7_9BILA